MHDILSLIHRQITVPPGLPVPNPTESAWQSPAHSISNTQSPTLPSSVDFLVIGSGITGTSVANTLLTHPSTADKTVLLLDARSAVSGATGRNGGHLVSDAHEYFSSLVEELGPTQAGDILRFSEANIARLKEIVSLLDEEDREDVELREVVSTFAILDEHMVNHVKRSLELVKEIVPNHSVKHEIIEDDSIASKYQYRGGKAILNQYQAGALRPYRLISAILRNLLKSHKNRFHLETNTPALSITTTTQGEYTVRTPRGDVKTPTVIHCTNAHAAHLLPNLTGILFPLKGTMSVQSPGSSFPQLGGRYSWTVGLRGNFEPSRHTLTTGLYYAQQNTKTGEVWIGGESQSVETLLSSDDSTVAPDAKRHIASIMPTLFLDAQDAKPRQIWSGIMGFTADTRPFVGHLDASLTGREGRGEWIAAGFNGHGMDKTWLSGEALAKMVLGEDVSGWFPKAYLLDKERLSGLDSAKAAENFKNMWLWPQPSTSHL